MVSAHVYYGATRSHVLCHVRQPATAKPDEITARTNWGAGAVYAAFAFIIDGTNLPHVLNLRIGLMCGLIVVLEDVSVQLPRLHRLLRPGALLWLAATRVSLNRKLGFVATC